LVQDLQPLVKIVDALMFHSFLQDLSTVQAAKGLITLQLAILAPLKVTVELLELYVLDAAVDPVRTSKHELILVEQLTLPHRIPPQVTAGAALV